MSGIGIKALNKTRDAFSIQNTGPNDSIHPDLVLRSSSEPPSGEGPSLRRTLVLFSGQTDIYWLRCLEPGFRHCWAMTETGQGWLSVDSQKHRLVLQHHDFKSFFRTQAALLDAGVQGIWTLSQEPPKRLAPVLPVTCVEVVKRLLGLHAYHIMTPYQLFRYLRKIDLDIS